MSVDRTPSAPTAAGSASADQQQQQQYQDGLITATALRQTLANNRHLVLLAQEVLCWERPVLAAVFAVAAHAVWALLCLNSLPPLSFICAVALGVLVLDGLVACLRDRIPARLRHLPALLPQSEKPTNTVRRIAGLTVSPLRSFEDLSEGIVDVVVSTQTHCSNLRAMREAHFGQATVFCITLCLILAFCTSFVPATVISYIPVAILLLYPPLERLVLVRVGLQRGGVYARMAVLAMLHFSNVIWTTFSIEPVTQDELNKRTSGFEEALRAALSQHQPPPLARSVAHEPAPKRVGSQAGGLHASVSEESFEFVSHDDAK